MPLDFPDTPAVGDMYGSTGTVWRWSGTMWESTSGASGSRGVVAYSRITASQAGIGTSYVDLAGLTLTFPMVAGRRYRISANCHGYGTTAGNVVSLALMEGSTTHYISQWILQSASWGETGQLIHVITATATATVTFKLQMAMSAGTGTVGAYATPAMPTYFMAEDITYEAGTSGIGIESAWVVATMGAGWSHYTSGRSQTAYRKIGDEVQLRVSASGGGTAAVGSTMFTLPAGYCPPGVLDIWGRDGGSTGLAVLYNITAAGLVQWFGSTPANNANLCCFICQFSVTA